MSRIASALSITLLGAGVGWAWPSAARACSCMPPRPPTEAIEQADAVFEGRTFGASPIDDMRVRYEFEVIRSWKGEIAERVVIVTNKDSAGCGRAYRAGASYLVYARRSPDEGLLHDNLCSRTREIDAATEDLEVLGPTSARNGGAAVKPSATVEAPVNEPPRIERTATGRPNDEPPATPPAKRGCAIIGPSAPPTLSLVLPIVAMTRRRCAGGR